MRLKQLEQAIDLLKQSDSLQNIRNQAVLSLGFYGALRGSEVLMIHVEHLMFLEQGLRISIPSSNTDQLGEGHQVFIPALGSKNATCPVKLISQWLDLSKIQNSLLFPSTKQSKEKRIVPISKSGFNNLLKSIAQECSWPNPQLYSSHSLRRGLATSASAAGASIKSIMKQGRGQSEKTALQYIEEDQTFDDNAVNALVKK